MSLIEGILDTRARNLDLLEGALRCCLSSRVRGVALLLLVVVDVV
jgi:hypothetical protein